VKIDIEFDTEWPWVMIGGLIGLGIGVIIIAIVNNDAVVEHNFRQYKIDHPSSTVTLEDYKRLKG